MKFDKQKNQKKNYKYILQGIGIKAIPPNNHGIPPTVLIKEGKYF